MDLNIKTYIIILLLILIFSVCEKNFDPLIPDTNNFKLDDYCNPPVPDSIPGKISEWELVGLKSANIVNIKAISVHPTKPYIMFAGSSMDFSYGISAKLFRSDNYGATWDTLRVGGYSYKSIVYDQSNPDIIYATNGILVKSYDCGLTWNYITSGMRVNWETGVLSIAIDPENHDILYAGTGGFFGGCLYKSIDGGNHWVEKTGDLSSVVCIEIDPKNSSVLYLGTDGIGDVLKSIDYGESWEKTGLHSTGLMVYDLLIDDKNTNIVYAALDHIDDPEFEVDFGIMKSEDSGFTWNRFNKGLPKDFKPYKIIKNTYTGDLYSVIYFGENVGGIYKMAAGDLSWEMIGIEGLKECYKSIQLSHDGSMLYVGGNGVYRMRLK